MRAGDTPGPGATLVLLGHLLAATQAERVSAGLGAGRAAGLGGFPVALGVRSSSLGFYSEVTDAVGDLHG